MGTSMGVIKYDTTSIDNYTVYDNRNTLLSNGIFSISIGPNDQVWFGTYGVEKGVRFPLGATCFQ